MSELLSLPTLQRLKTGLRKGDIVHLQPEVSEPLAQSEDRGDIKRENGCGEIAELRETVARDIRVEEKKVEEEQERISFRLLHKPSGSPLVVICLIGMIGQVGPAVQDSRLKTYNPNICIQASMNCLFIRLCDQIRLGMRRCLSNRPEIADLFELSETLFMRQPSQNQPGRTAAAAAAHTKRTPALQTNSPGQGAAGIPGAAVFSVARFAKLTGTYRLGGTAKHRSLS
ncbi:hypothetical protein PoB_005015100 [Plakobranchus ocellatus]|uniref:Uncharacterized protein n=1 Tax=Plakobranchus ocellatus TaxID=259542 RepID=A0AAV4BT63_9GAST|nr:hypothetical protein PoB_005015100 [Plakobranchus ocellatus]